MSDTSKTRVCIKNLPPTATEQDVKVFLKETSKERIDITDCKVLKNAKGKSRKVAFVGFRQEEQAKYVIDTFHRTFMRLSRLSVEPALSKRDETQKEDASPKKKGDKDTSKSSTAAINSSSVGEKKANESSLKSKHKEEILQLIGGSGSKAKFWANDEDAPVLETEPIVEKDVKVIPESNGSDSDTGSSSSSSDESDEESVEDDEGVENKAKEVLVKNANAGLSDLDFLRSKQKATDDLEEDEDDDSTSDTDSKSNASKEKVHEDPTMEDDMETDSEADGSESSSSSSSDDSEEEDDKDEEVSSKKQLETVASKNDNGKEDEVDDGNEELDAKKDNFSQSRLFVRNLSYGTTEEELEQYFSPFGTVVECHIPVDDQKRNKGFAFIQYASAVDALTARKQLDKVDFQGRLLHILPARPAPVSESTDNDNANQTWKQRQEQARKEQDIATKNGGSAKGWSASFVRGDAVVDSLADRLGLRKGDLLGVKDKLSSGDAAVRLALGETQIIEENREYFREHGVDMEALVGATGGDEKTTARSKTSLLVKNLPYDTKVEELHKLFQLGDETVKILLPPSRTIALVEYGHPSEAKAAFRKLAYRRFKHVPIYLEWAPVAAKLPDGAQWSSSETTTVEAASTTKQNLLAEEQERDADVTSGPTTTIFVKNLNFSTDEDTVKKIFEKHVGKVVSVRIPQKIAPSKNKEEPQVLSMGYGFVELESASAAQEAIKKLQGKLVQGHAWEVTISSGNKKGSSGQQEQRQVQSGGKQPTKLVVRNVPFQATRTELLKLFGTFGQLRRVRLPKKFDGSHRGFAFVEFLTNKEAVAAKNALSRTHLYGRHLVLEWATEDDQDVDRLREKAKRNIGENPQPQNKKIRFT